MTFKKGDKVRVKKNCNGSVVDKIYTLLELDPGYGCSLYAYNEESFNEMDEGCSCPNNWILVLVKDINIRELNSSLIKNL